MIEPGGMWRLQEPSRTQQPLTGHDAMIVVLLTPVESIAPIGKVFSVCERAKETGGYVFYSKSAGMILTEQGDARVY